MRTAVAKKDIEYSPSERELLDCIPMDGKKITIEELTKRRYARDREPPFNATGSVRATLSQLMRKVDHNLETFRIRKGRRMGPISSEVWVEKRGR